MGWIIQIRIPAEVIYAFLQNAQTGFGAYSASYSLDTGVPLRANWPGPEVYHSPPSSAKVKNE
jgi:hypothetical protein